MPVYAWILARFGFWLRYAIDSEPTSPPTPTTACITPSPSAPTSKTPSAYAGSSCWYDCPSSIVTTAKANSDSSVSWPQM